jgi:hypothetical protein
MSLPIKSEINRKNSVGPNGNLALDPLYCATHYALEADHTLIKFVTRLNRLYGFDQRLSKQLVAKRLEHEFAHGLLALVLARMKRSVMPHDFGHNGSELAESIVLPLEQATISIFPEWPLSYSNSIDLRYPGSPAIEEIVASQQRIWSRNASREHDQLLKDKRICDESPTPLSLFEARQQQEFPNLDGSIGFFRSVKFSTKWEEQSPELNLKTSDVKEIYYYSLTLLQHLRQEFNQRKTNYPELEPKEFFSNYKLRDLEAHLARITDFAVFEKNEASRLKESESHRKSLEAAALRRKNIKREMEFFFRCIKHTPSSVDVKQMKQALCAKLDKDNVIIDHYKATNEQREAIRELSRKLRDATLGSAPTNKMRRSYEKNVLSPICKTWVENGTAGVIEDLRYRITFLNPLSQINIPWTMRLNEPGQQEITR